jgi:hypothetical protein
MNEQDIEAWCDETLPELYDEGMFDLEEISEDVWDACTAAMEPVLEAFDNEDEREQMAEDLTDAARAWFKAHHDLILEALGPVESEVVDLLCNKPQTAQHSADWYNQRRNRLTASEFAQILDGRRGALLRQKLASGGDRVGFNAPIGICQPDGEMNATTWGHRFESITRHIYELEIAGPNTVNDGLGRFTHATVPWLSASPDGLVTKGPLRGRLVEIKSPKTRQPGEFVPNEYYVQMQIQMEVCDLDAVDFVEAQFAQRPLHPHGRGLAAPAAVPCGDNRGRPIESMSEADEAACSKATWKGRIEVRGHLEDSSTWRYHYTDPVEDLEDAVFKTDEDGPLLESSVWWLTGWYPRTVLRNNNWWQSVGWPNAQLFWAEVCSLRDQQTETVEHVDCERIGWVGS